MGVNGAQITQASWLLKTYWRSSCGRTLSPATELCHNCGDSRPDATPPLNIVSELDHACGPSAPALIRTVLDSLLPE